MPKTRFYFRLDEDIAEAFRAQARDQNMSYTDYVTLLVMFAPRFVDARGALLDEREIKHAFPLVVKNEVMLMHGEFRMQGNNLNQAARALNTIAAKGENLDRSDLAAMASDIVKRLDDIAESQTRLNEKFDGIVERLSLQDRR